MRSHSVVSVSLKLLALMLVAATATPAAQAQSPQFYQTVLHLQQPVVNVSSVDRVIYRWSTTQTNGTVGELALEDLVLELRTPAGRVYLDHIIVNGVAQPFSGMPRVIGGGFDVYWRFDLDTSTLEEMTNVSLPVIMASTGLHFDVHDSTSIPDDGRVSIKAYIDGVNQDPHTDQLDVQVTLPMLFFDDFETGDASGWTS